MKTSQVPAVPCHGCGNDNDMASHETATPKPGDLALCYYCGSISKYTDTLGKAPLSDRELLLLQPEEQADLMLRKARIRSMWKARGFKDGVGKPSKEPKDPKA